jgi:hypothetical protein
MIDLKLKAGFVYPLIPSSIFMGRTSILAVDDDSNTGLFLAI